MCATDFSSFFMLHLKPTHRLSGPVFRTDINHSKVATSKQHDMDRTIETRCIDYLHFISLGKIPPYG